MIRRDDLPLAILVTSAGVGGKKGRRYSLGMTSLLNKMVIGMTILYRKKLKTKFINNLKIKSMKFKTLSMLLTLVAALCLIGCTKDPAMNGSENGGQEDSGRKIFLSAGIALPTSSSTRSGTDNTENGSNDTGNDRTNSDRDADEDDSQPDYEYGYDYESDVRSILMVLATAEDNKYITHTFVSNVSEAPETGKKFDFVVTGELSYDDLEEAYNGKDGTPGLLATDKDVNIWLYCNYTGNMVTKFKDVAKGSTDWLDFTGLVEESPADPSTPADIPNTIWAKGSFLMTNANAKDNTFTFPDDVSKWDPYTDKSNPFRLTIDGSQPGTLKAIRVERAAARIDFKDVSEYEDENGEPLANTYGLKYITKRATGDNGSGEKSLNLYSVTLNRMSLVNMSKNFYYLRRVSNDGLFYSQTNKFEVAGSEYWASDNAFNYVVDTDADKKSTKSITVDNANQYFNFPLFTTTGSYNNMGGWYVDKIENIIDPDNGIKDNWEGRPAEKPYYVWRYVTENTIPGPENQITVQSTGIVFKGKIILGKDATDESKQEEVAKYMSESVKNALNNDIIGDSDKTEAEARAVLPDLYSHGGALYAGIGELVAAAAEAKGSTLNTGLDLALEHWVAEKDKTTFAYYSDEDLKKLKEEDKIGVTLTSVICDKLINHSEDLDDEELYGEDGYEYKDYTIDFTKDYYESSSDDTLSKDDQAAYDAAVYNFNKAVAAVDPIQLGVTVYRASNEKDGDGWGYYCYYFYWNRHNDNLKSGKMGPMEFATVRNNVYKLSVKTISEFGHPRVTDFDPEPVDPEDPDEDPKVYFQVQVEVLPWVVRVNDIEF